MDDSNIVLNLKSGEEIKVIYPQRLFIEYHTPWLDRPGGVQTSDPSRDLASYTSGKYFMNANFVISVWENFPKYESMTDKRIRTIPMASVAGVVPADAADAEIGNRIKQEELDSRLDQSYRDGVVSRKELAALFPDLADRILTRPKDK
jgi:hypothetical protein